MVMADIQITAMAIIDIGILIVTAMAIDCENGIESHFLTRCPNEQSATR